MGLLHTSTVAQKVFAVAQYEIWTGVDTFSQSDEHSEPMEVSQLAQQPHRRSLYSASSLLSESDKKKKKPSCREYELREMGQGQEDERQRKNNNFATSLPAPQTIDRRNQPMTVVFETNGAEFKFFSKAHKSEPSQSVFIQSCDLIDRDGKTSEKLSK